MIYKLFHKNTEVLTADFTLESNSFNKIMEISNEDHIPIGLTTMPEMDLTKALNFWWQSRLIPKNRNNFKKEVLLANILKDSNGFNLSDHYWIRPETSDMTWEKGNYIQNCFNEDIGEYLISEKNNFQNMTSDSPDFFSNGEQDKRWVIKKKIRTLLKYGRPPYYQQPFNEMLATEICRRLNIPHVSYSFIIKGKANPLIYSSCPCFIDENTEYVPAGFIQYVLKKEKGISEYQHLLNCCKAIGMKDIDEIENRITEMNIVDYITANTDRHYGNFGFIRNVNTLEWKGFAPIFDTGNAMFYDFPTSDFRKSTALMENVISKSFAQTQKKQIIKFATKEAYLNIDFSKLKGIENYYHYVLQKNPKVDSERASLLSKLLFERIENIQRLILVNNNVTKEFLSNINKNTEDIPFVNKIASEKKKIEIKNKMDNLIINNYLKNLNPSSPLELENLIKKDIEAIHKKNRSANKTKADNDGISGRA